MYWLEASVQAYPLSNTLGEPLRQAPLLHRSLTELPRPIRQLRVQLLWAGGLQRRQRQLNRKSDARLQCRIHNLAGFNFALNCVDPNRQS